MFLRFIPLAVAAVMVTAGLTGCSAAPKPSCMVTGVRLYPIESGPDGKPGRQADVGVGMSDDNVREIRSVAKYLIVDKTTGMELHGTPNTNAVLPLGHLIRITVTVNLISGERLVCSPREFRVPLAAPSPTPTSAAA